MTNLSGMLPEFGQLALIFALLVAAVQMVVPLVGVRRGQAWLMAYARPLASAQALFLIISLVILAYCFVVDDFSVAYVAKNSNTALPTAYKISAVWGGARRFSVVVGHHAGVLGAGRCLVQPIAATGYGGAGVVHHGDGVGGLYFVHPGNLQSV